MGKLCQSQFLGRDRSCCDVWGGVSGTMAGRVSGIGSWMRVAGEVWRGHEDEEYEEAHLYWTSVGTLERGKGDYERGERMGVWVVTMV